MTRDERLTELAFSIAGHQARIEQLGAKWGAVLIEKLDATEQKILNAITDFMKTNRGKSMKLSGLTAMKRLEKKLIEIRKAAWENGYEELHTESIELGLNEEKWANRLTQEIFKTNTGKGGGGKYASKLLNESQMNETVEKKLIGSRTFREWFKRTSDADYGRIIDMVREGFVSGMTIPEMMKRIRGSKAGNYEDGIMQTSRRHAQTLARTLCSGVANLAKNEFYLENDDMVMAVEWLDTLDGRTCVSCGGLSRMRWATNEAHPIPPLHPNCRCVLIPVTELTDLGEDSYRPMANADFNAEAKRLYEAKYPGKKFSDLAASTRKKYYYRAMREYERRTGKKAYDRAPGQMSFREYFLQMSEEQKLDYLGKRKYELWKTGKYTVEDFIPPWPNRAMTVKELKLKDQESFI